MFNYLIWINQKTELDNLKLFSFTILNEEKKMKSDFLLPCKWGVAQGKRTI